MKHPIAVAKAPVRLQVTIPGSKSMTNRALMLAALADGVSELSNVLISDDTLTFVNALRDLGISIQLDKATRSCIIGGANGNFPRKDAMVRCDDAGMPARFLLAACASSSGSFHFDASLHLRKKPITSLLKALIRLGANIIPCEATQMPFTILGMTGLKGGEVDIDASETGQFISALLMVSPFAKQPLFIRAEHSLSQPYQPYIEMTCRMMADFNVLVRRMHRSWFSIPVPQRYLPRNYTIEPDLSTAAYFFAAAAVTGGQVTIQSLNREKSKQGEVEFLRVLEKMGCHVVVEATGLTVFGPKELRGVSVDMRYYSDTFMTLAALAPFATTPTTMTNIGHVRKKELDRIAVMHAELEKLQVKVEEGKDWIKVYPSIPHPGTIDSHQDQRIAMAFAIIGLRVPGIYIDGAECVSKTYPEFFERWDKLSVS